jgi:excisionase family DNA binding protein
MSPRFSTAPHDERGNPRPFCSVAETARMLGTSEMTLYRAIAAGEFPAVRIRGRIIVPRRVIDAMADAAMDSNGLVDTSEWTGAWPQTAATPGESPPVARRPGGAQPGEAQGRRAAHRVSAPYGGAVS